MDISATVAACREKWGEDDNARELETKVSKWLSPVSGEDEKQILIMLLERFEYYSWLRLNEKLVSLYQEFRAVAKNIENTIYTPIRSYKRHFNSSDEMVIEFRKVNSLSHLTIITDLGEITRREEWQLIENIVFVDDASGTGKTFIGFLKHYSEVIKGKNVYLLVVAISEIAEENIRNFGETNGLNIIIRSTQIYKKAFEKGYIFTGDHLDNAKSVIEKREVLIWGDRENPYIMGIDRSEALVSFVMNTPNNTISCFWSTHNQDWFPLFPRRRDFPPAWRRLSAKRKQQGVTSYKAATFKETRS